jgi:hypothetical protein
MLLPNVSITNIEYEVSFTESQAVVRFKPGERAFINWFLKKDPDNLEVKVKSD